MAQDPNRRAGGITRPMFLLSSRLLPVSLIDQTQPEAGGKRAFDAVHMGHTGQSGKDWREGGGGWRPGLVSQLCDDQLLDCAPGGNREPSSSPSLFPPSAEQRDRV